MRGTFPTEKVNCYYSAFQIYVFTGITTMMTLIMYIFVYFINV